MLLLSALFTFAASLGFLLYSFDLLDILFDSSQSVLGSSLLVLISPSMFLLPLLTVVNTVHESNKNIKAVCVSLGVGVIVKTLLSILLVPTSLGIHGAAISTTVSYIVSLIISFFYLDNWIVVNYNSCKNQIKMSHNDDRVTGTDS